MTKELKDLNLWMEYVDMKGLSKSLDISRADTIEQIRQGGLKKVCLLFL